MAELFFSFSLSTNPQALSLREARAACPQSRHGMSALHVRLLAALWNVPDTQWGFSPPTFFFLF